MPSIRDAEESLRYTLKYVHPLLWIIGAWPIPSSSSLSSKFLQWFQRFISSLIILMFLISSTLFLLFKVRNGRTQIKLSTSVLNCLSQYIKYTILLLHTNELQKTLEDIKQDWLSATEENLLILRTKAQVGNRVVLMVIITMYGSGVGYRLLLPLLRGRVVLPNNISIRMLPCPGYFGAIDEHITPNYEIIFTMQVLAGFVNYTILCGSIGTIALLCLHTAGLLKILMSKMIELSDQLEVTEKSVQEKIVEIVEYQTKIKEFIRNVEQITQNMFSSEIFFDTCLTCVVGYCVITEWEDSNPAAVIIYFLLQATCMFAVFTICYIGQDLLDESNDLSKTSITLNWYRFPTDKARCLVLMINMSNHPIKLTAAKTVDVSLATFTDIIKLSMGYLNILRDVV